METKNLTIEQCETFEDELTQKAIDYANLIKTPQQRALAAKDVITGLPDKEITLAYRDGFQMQLSELSTETARQIVNLRNNCQVQHTDYAGKTDKEIAKAKAGVAGLEKKVDSIDVRIGTCTSSTKDMRQKFYDHIQEVATGSRVYADRLRQNERDVGELQERKASKKSVWLLAAITTLQSAYIGVELARNPDTYFHKTYTAVRNWFGQ